MIALRLSPRLLIVIHRWFRVAYRSLGARTVIAGTHNRVVDIGFITIWFRWGYNHV